MSQTGPGSPTGGTTTTTGASRRRARPALAIPLLPLLTLVLLTLGSLAFATACGSEPSHEPGPPIPSLTIRGQNVKLDVARTREEQVRGLGYRDSLAWDSGMLFLYDEPGFYGFWMKGMRFDIDIVWIRGDRIVDITHRVPHSPEGPGPTVRPRELTDTVLEVPAGYAQARGWRVRDRVEFYLEASP